MSNKIEIEQEVKRVLQERTEKLLQGCLNVLFSVIFIAASWAWSMFAVYLLPKIITELSLSHTQKFVISAGIAGGAMMPIIVLFMYLGLFEEKKK